MRLINFFALLGLVTLGACSSYNVSTSKDYARKIASDNPYSLTSSEKEMLDFLNFKKNALVYKGKGYTADKGTQLVDCYVFVGIEDATNTAIGYKRNLIRVDYLNDSNSKFTDSRYFWFSGLNDRLGSYLKDNSFGTVKFLV